MFIVSVFCLSIDGLFYSVFTIREIYKSKLIFITFFIIVLIESLITYFHHDNLKS